MACYFGCQLSLVLSHSGRVHLKFTPKCKDTPERSRAPVSVLAQLTLAPCHPSYSVRPSAHSSIHVYLFSQHYSRGLQTLCPFVFLESAGPKNRCTLARAGTGVQRPSPGAALMLSPVLTSICPAVDFPSGQALSGLTFVFLLFSF